MHVVSSRNNGYNRLKSEKTKTKHIVNFGDNLKEIGEKLKKLK